MPRVLGWIAAGDPQTVAAAASILRQGGNAADALVAAGFAALLAEPFLVNIGGGGLALACLPQTGRVVAYDFMVDMPSRKPWPGMDFRRLLVHFEATSVPFYVGRAAAGVPGLVAGLCRIHADLGRLPLKQVMEPALRLAYEGAVLSAAQVRVLRVLREIFRLDPALKALFFPQGRMVKPGTRIARPDLARTLARIAEEGPDVFYKGDLAQAIAADQERHGGLITLEDLASYRVLVLEPIQVRYRSWQVFLPPPPSRGGGLVALALHLLRDFPLNDLGFHSVEHIHLLASVMAEVHRARPAWEALLKQPTPNLAAWLHPELLAHRREAVQHAWIQGRAATASWLEPSTHPNTTHISVMDADGLVLSMTVSAGEDAGFIVPGTGIQLNNMLGEDDLNPEGFHRLPPRTRLGTMMTPLIARHPEQGLFAVGSGGSARIRDAVLQTFSAFVDFLLPLEEAVSAPRVHLDAKGVLHLEHGIAEATANALAHMGYNVHLWPTMSLFFGGTHAIAGHPSGTGAAAGDPRRGGAAAVVTP